MTSHLDYIMWLIISFSGFIIQTAHKTALSHVVPSLTLLFLAFLNAYKLYTQS